MHPKTTRQFFATLLFALISPWLPAQFQHLNAHGTFTTPVTGIYRDVQCMDVTGQNGENVVAVGTSRQVPANGLLAYHDVNGIPVNYLQLTNPAGNNVEAEAICSTPVNNHVVSCYFDPVSFASDVVVTDINGALVWTTRIYNLRVRDVTAAASPAPGGETIWLTGNTNVPNVAVAALDGAGTLIFATEYVIQGNYNNTVAYEIDFSTTMSRLTVIGKSSIGNCTDGMLIIRLQPNGTVVWANVYNDPNCTWEYKGRCVVQRPGLGNRYIAAFLYKDPLNPSQAFPGLMQINAAGAPMWTRTYTGAGFFAGTDFQVRGLDTDGSGLLVSGLFQSPANPAPQVSGYTLSTNLNGFGNQFNEYEMGSAVPVAGNRLTDMDYHPGENSFYVVGEFIAPASAGIWPQGTNPVSFWMVKSDGAGTSDCSGHDNPTAANRNPNVGNVTFQPGGNFDQAGSPLNLATVTPIWVNQCPPPVPKTGNHQNGPEDENSNLGVQISFLEGLQQLRVDIPSTVEGTTEISIIDLSGRHLASAEVQPGANFLDLGMLSGGVYLVRYRLPGQMPAVKKVAVR